jgi:two-component system, OmpR family, response regulator
VRAVLRRSGREVSPVWQVADLVVDEAVRTVQRGGVEVALTPTEFDVLVALGRQRGTVVGKHKLLAAVWGFQAHDLNLVDTYVSTLRRKLEAHGPRLVHTVRGVGLVLRP